MVARYGADATRMYSLFAAPPDRDLDWQGSGIEGIQRFLGRVYRFYLRNPMERKQNAPPQENESLLPEARALQRHAPGVVAERPDRLEILARQAHLHGQRSEFGALAVRRAVICRFVHEA